MNIDIELYKPYTIDSEISQILGTYEKKFGINLSESLDEIRTLFSKISNIKQVMRLDIMYLDSDGNEMRDSDSILYSEDGEIRPDIYFKIEYNINSIIQSKS